MESQVVECDLNRHKCSLKNVFWQRTMCILKVTNCTLFCFHCLSSCPEAVDCFNFHSSEKPLLCRGNSSNCKHSKTAETIFVMAVFYATLYSCFLLLTDISDMNPDLNLYAKIACKFWCSFFSELGDYITNLPLCPQY